MPLQDILNELKQLDLTEDDASLAIVNERHKHGELVYDLQYVRTEPSLQEKLREIVIQTIQEANTVEEYTFDSPEPEGDEVRGMEVGGTKFDEITEALQGLNPEIDAVE